MQLSDHVDTSDRIPFSGDASTQGFVGSPLHIERLMLVSIRLCEYVSCRAFTMSHRARYIG